MNLWQKIKAFFAVKSFVETEIKEARMVTASGKPGYLSTEFWMNVVTQLGVLWGVVHGFVPAPWNIIIPVAATAIYTVARTVAKAIADIQAAKASGTVPPVPAPAA